jgi:hypothetical protein
MRSRGLLASAVAGVCLFGFAGVARAETIEVTTTADPTVSTCPGSECSLRRAVAVAKPGDVLQLAGTAGTPDVYQLTQGSQIVVSKSMTIQGNGVDATTVDGSGNAEAGKALSRILKVTAGTINVKGLRFTGGDDGNDENFESCSPCLTLNANGGGALFNSGATVTLEDVDFDSNGVGSGQPLGGAISNTGTLEMKNVLFENDNAAFGGGLFARSGSVTALDVTFEEDGLSAFDGGAIFVNGGSVSLTNTTVVDSGWASAFGGGIDNKGGTLTLLNDTLSGNLRGSLETDTGGNTTVQNTIIGSGFSDNVDFGCVAAGKENGANATTGKAITTDLGNNIDQDGACALSASGDKTEVDPKLASIAENGGPIPTQALLHGSAAIDAANDAACPATDARGTARPQGTHCDVGAFEAVLLGQPTAATDGTIGLTSSSAVLQSTIDFAGEAGGFHFLWGTSPAELINETSEVGAGVLSSDTPESQQLFGLSPETTYFYKAVADNASGSVAAGTVEQLTTEPAPQPPTISKVSVASVTETTATITASINPGGADTEYWVEYGRDEGYGEETERVDIGAGRGPKSNEETVTGLEPGQSYHFDVVAENQQEPNGVRSSDGELTTSSASGPPASGGGSGSETPVSSLTGNSLTLSTGLGTVVPGIQAAVPATLAALPAPVLGKSVNVEVLSGKVLIALPAAGAASAATSRTEATDSLSKGLHFIPLTEARQIPVGSTLETTAGVARIETATVGKPQLGDFGAGIFKLLQQRSQRGLTELNIVNNLSPKKVCATLGKGAAVAAKLSSKVLGRIHGSAHGSFVTKGQYSAATVRGTIWSVSNQCNGTLTKVTRDVVTVRDFRRRKTITLLSGQSYLAKAPG